MNLTTEIFGNCMVVHAPQDLGREQADRFKNFLHSLERSQIVLDIDGERGQQLEQRRQAQAGRDGAELAHEGRRHLRHVAERAPRLRVPELGEQGGPVGALEPGRVAPLERPHRLAGDLAMAQAFDHRGAWLRDQRGVQRRAVRGTARVEAGERDAGEHVGARPGRAVVPERREPRRGAGLVEPRAEVGRIGDVGNLS